MFTAICFCAHAMCLLSAVESKADAKQMNPIEMSRHFLELDALRAKVKKTVDTKASKGSLREGGRGGRE